jgi:SpoVK/Ycf46/Vps4 family AAA+-type ATPase
MDQQSKAQSGESRAAKMLREIFESGRPLTYVNSVEEQRVARVLREVGQRIESTPIPVWTWSLTEGMGRANGEAEAEAFAARQALDFIAAHKEPAIFQLKDFHEPMRESAEIRRRLRDLYAACLDRRKFVVISSPIRFVPQELGRDIMYVELGLPDIVELVDFLRDEAQRISALGASADLSEATLYQLGRAMLGLTLDEARHAIRRALAANRHLGAESVPALLEEKRLLVGRTGVIEFVSAATDITQVGGLASLKKWLLERRKLLQLGGDQNTEITPKGLLVMGIPGCGKSLAAKSVASCFDLPLYRLDMIQVFSGRYGPPEGVFVQACKTIEEMAPAVVWFDEIEMGITSTASGGEHGRIFAFFLTWMQEKPRGLFVAATANRIDLLPAEMIRKGRFDEVFFVDLPLEDERTEIFKIHLERRGVDPARFNFEEVVDFSKGWTGAEIEQCVVSALTKARLEDRELTQTDLVNRAVGVVPLSRTMQEQINQIRGWAHDRAAKASLVTIRRWGASLKKQGLH